MDGGYAMTSGENCSGLPAVYNLHASQAWQPAPCAGTYPDACTVFAYSDPEGGRLVSYELTIIEKPTYLHFVVTGENSRDTVAHYMEEVMRLCAERNFPRALVEERLQGPRLSTIDVFCLSAAMSMRYIGALKSLAYVDVYAVGDTMKFAENVAVNRGFPARVFSTVAAAEKWLVGDPPRGVPPDATLNGGKPHS